MAGGSNKGGYSDRIAIWILMLLALAAYLPVAYVIEHGILSSVF